MKYTFNKSSRGFTLIELMIAVAIIAILAAFAIPSFHRYVDQAKLSEGTYYLAMGGSDQFRIEAIYGNFSDRLKGGDIDHPNLSVDFPSPKFDLIVGQVQNTGPSMGGSTIKAALSSVHPEAFPSGYLVANNGFFGLTNTSGQQRNFTMGVEGSLSGSSLRFVMASTRTRNVFLLCDGYSTTVDTSAMAALEQNWGAAGAPNPGSNINCNATSTVCNDPSGCD